MSITPYLPLVAKRASVLHGSVLDANHPAKWVSFGCNSTLRLNCSMVNLDPEAASAVKMKLNAVNEREI